METNLKKYANTRAFACVGYSPDSGGHLQDGLTIREYFAAKAMQGICVNAGRNGHKFHQADELAKEAVKIADALISALANEA